MSDRVVINGATGQIGRSWPDGRPPTGCRSWSRRVDPPNPCSSCPTPSSTSLRPDQSGPWQYASDGARAVMGLGGAPFIRTRAGWGELERVATGGCIRQPHPSGARHGTDTRSANPFRQRFCDHACPGECVGTGEEAHLRQCVWPDELT